MAHIHAQPVSMALGSMKIICRDIEAFSRQSFHVVVESSALEAHVG